jgi:hypothetical protein
MCSCHGIHEVECSYLFNICIPRLREFTLQTCRAPSRCYVLRRSDDDDVNARRWAITVRVTTALSKAPALDAESVVSTVASTLELRGFARVELERVSAGLGSHELTGTHSISAAVTDSPVGWPSTTNMSADVAALVKALYTEARASVGESMLESALGRVSAAQIDEAEVRNITSLATFSFSVPIC